MELCCWCYGYKARSRIRASQARFSECETVFLRKVHRRRSKAVNRITHKRDESDLPRFQKRLPASNKRKSDALINRHKSGHCGAERTTRESGQNGHSWGDMSQYVMTLRGCTNQDKSSHENPPKLGQTDRDKSPHNTAWECVQNRTK